MYTFFSTTKLTDHLLFVAILHEDGTELFGLLEAFTREFVARHGALLQGVLFGRLGVGVCFLLSLCLFCFCYVCLTFCLFVFLFV